MLFIAISLHLLLMQFIVTKGLLQQKMFHMLRSKSSRKGGFVRFSAAVPSTPYKCSDSKWQKADQGKTLVIVESPAKARTIQKYLDSDKFIVDYSAGHIRDLKVLEPKRHQKYFTNGLPLTVGSTAVDIFHDFQAMYRPLPDKAAVIARLKSQAAKASRILLATDGDREGEAISWHLVETLQPKVPYKVC
jgi:hypothetical protein